MIKKFSADEKIYWSTAIKSQNWSLEIIASFVLPYQAADDPDYSIKNAKLQ